MPVDMNTRRLDDHTNVPEADPNEEITLDSSQFGTRNITVENFTNQIIGGNDISNIGDGTPTGAIVELDERLTEAEDTIGDTDISAYADGTLTGILANFATQNVTIPVSGWSDVAPFSNTVTVSGISASDKIMCLGYVPSNTPEDNVLIAQATSRLDYGITGNNSITWYALELKPEMTVTVVIMKVY